MPQDPRDRNQAKSRYSLNGGLLCLQWRARAPAICDCSEGSSKPRAVRPRKLYSSKKNYIHVFSLPGQCYNHNPLWSTRASLVAPLVRNLPAVQETQVRSLDQNMATHSSMRAWRIPWTKEPDRLQSMKSQRVGHDWATDTSLMIHTGASLPPSAPCKLL